LRTWNNVKARWAFVKELPPNPNRNLHITLFYQEVGHLFCRMMRDHLPDFHLNWLQLGAWASNTVGLGIQRKLGSTLAKEILKHVPGGQFLSTAVESVEWLLSDAYSPFVVGMHQGNLLVFSEVGRGFVEFALRSCSTTAPVEQEVFTEWLASTFSGA
jgi:hypothetical protein